MNRSFNLVGGRQTVSHELLLKCARRLWFFCVAERPWSISRTIFPVIYFFKHASRFACNSFLLTIVEHADAFWNCMKSTVYKCFFFISYFLRFASFTSLLPVLSNLMLRASVRHHYICQLYHLRYIRRSRIIVSLFDRNHVNSFSVISHFFHYPFTTFQSIYIEIDPDIFSAILTSFSYTRHSFLWSVPLYDIQ